MSCSTAPQPVGGIGMIPGPISAMRKGAKGAFGAHFPRYVRARSRQSRFSTAHARISFRLVMPVTHSSEISLVRSASPSTMRIHDLSRGRFALASSLQRTAHPAASASPITSG